MRLLILATLAALSLSAQTYTRKTVCGTNPTLTATNAAGSGMCSAAVTVSGPPPSGGITINAGVTYQTMQGWGTTERVFDDPHLFNNFDSNTGRSLTVMSTADQNAILNLLYTNLKLTWVRTANEQGVEVNNDGVFNFAWNDAHVDYVKRAIALGMPATNFFMSPIARESWMDPGQYGDVVAYSDWLFAIISRWRDYGGIDPPWQAISNEPSYNRNPMSGEFVRDVINNLGPRLRAAGFQTKFVLPDDIRSSDAARVANIVMSDSVAAPFVGSLATHLYDEPISNVSSIQAVADAYNLPLWMTEFTQSASGSIDGISYAEGIMHPMINDYNVSMQMYLWGFFGNWVDSRETLISLNYGGAAYTGYTLNQMYYVMGQYSRHIPPGTVRVGVTSDQPAVKVTGYNNAGKPVIVAINNTAATISTNLNFVGFEGVTSIQRERTSNSGENGAVLSSGTVTGNTIVVNLLPYSITTYWTSGLAPSPTCSLSASSSSITAGQSSTLTWSTTGSPTNSTIDNGIGPVSLPNAGSVNVSPTVSTVYTMTATNAVGSGSCSATVNVTGIPSNGITINAGVTYQTMQGFGVGERVFDDPHVFNNFDPATGRSLTVMSLADQNAILDLLYTNLKMTWSHPITEEGIEAANNGIFNFAWKRNDAYVDYTQRAIARGASAKSFFLYPVFREPWMGVTTASDVAAYSDWLTAIIRRWRVLGLDVPWLPVGTEPSFERNNMSGQFIRDVIKRLGPQLRSEGFATMFMVPDDVRSTSGESVAGTILADPAARAFVGAVSTHLYDESVTNVAKIKAVADAYGLPLWMTEYSQGAGGYPDAISYAASIMHPLISDYNVSVQIFIWGFFGALAPDGFTLISANYGGASYNGYTLNKMYYVTGQFSRHIPPGTVRVGVTSSNTDVKVTGYNNAGTPVIVAINNTPNPVTTNINLTGFGGVSTIQRERTSNGAAPENLATLSSVNVSGNTFVDTLKENSITTYWTGGVAAPTATCSLSASPSAITVGQSSTLTWSTTGNPTSSTITSIGAVTPASAGSTVVSPTVSTGYTMTTTNAVGSGSCSATIAVSSRHTGKRRLYMFAR